MARIRTIKPEFWADEKVGPLDPIHRLVFLGLVSQADDAGRLVDNVRTLDGLLFPYTDDSCGPSLVALAEIKRIRRYSSDSGQRLLQIEGWEKHQKVKNPSTYVLPAPSGGDSTEGRGTVGGEVPPEIPQDVDNPQESNDSGHGGESTETLRRVGGDPNAPIPDPLSPIPDLGSPIADRPAHTRETAASDRPAVGREDVSQTDALEALVTYVGEPYREAVKAVAAMPGVGVLWATGLLKTWGPEGSMVGDQVAAAQRPAAVGLALQRYAEDRQTWYGPGFKAFVLKAATDLRDIVLAREKAAHQRQGTSGVSEDAKAREAEAIRKLNEQAAQAGVSVNGDPMALARQIAASKAIPSAKKAS